MPLVFCKLGNTAEVCVSSRVNRNFNLNCLRRDSYQGTMNLYLLLHKRNILYELIQVGVGFRFGAVLKNLLMEMTGFFR